MSRLIKSKQCMEAYPCRLEPVDVDAFFITPDNIATEPDDLKSPTDQEEYRQNEEDSAIFQGQEPEGENAVTLEPRLDESVSQLAPNIVAVKRTSYKPPRPEGLDMDRLANVAEQIGALIDGFITPNVELAVTSEVPVLELKPEVRESLENAFAEARQRVLPEMEASSPKFKTSQNDEVNTEISENAGRKAGLIVEGARLQSGMITETAKKQADHVLEKANMQAEGLLITAREKADEIIALATEQANAAVETASQQATEIIATANQEGITLKEQAQQEGSRVGYDEGILKARQELQLNLTQSLGLLTQAETEREQRILSSEPELLKLAVAIAEKILAAELALDSSSQLAIVREALARVSTANLINIRVNSEDLAVLESQVSALQDVFNEPKPLKFIADASIDRGNCFIETENGNVDSRIKSQLEQILVELLKVEQFG